MIKSKLISYTALYLSAFALLACGGGSSVPSPSAVVPPTPPVPPTPTPVSEAPTIDVAEEGDILVNQNSYSSKGLKFASLVRSDAAPIRWELRDASDRVYISGQTVSKGASPLSGLTLHEIDFSDYQTLTSNLRLVVGDKESALFNISERPFQNLTKDSAKYFYQSRAASAVEDTYVVRAIPALSRAAGHTKQDLTCFSGMDDYGTDWPSCGYSKTISKGWYDAGDYGLYGVNTGMVLWTMQNQYERLLGDDTTCKLSKSTTRALNIPESNNDIHDLLDETRIGMEFLLSLQIQTDTPIAMALGRQTEGEPLQLTQISARGMLHHKVHGLQFPADNIIPEDDTQTRYLYPPSTSATLHLAATGAQCARIWAGINDEFALRCLNAAIQAYEAAQAIPDAYAYDNFDGGGPYADVDFEDEFSWAATELFLTTGEEKYSQDMLTYTPIGYLTNGRVQPSWRDTQPLGMMSVATQYLKDPSRVASALEQENIDGLIAIAAQYNEQREITGFNVPDDNPEYYWGSNVNLLNRAILAATVSDIQSISYQNDIVSIMDYLLGHNPLNQSYITGYGDQTVENPHHRFWSNVIDGSNPKPPAGVLSSGPNNFAMVDPISSQLEGQCLAQTCWVDDFDAFTFNEVGINYNATLTWVTDWLDSKAQTCQE